MGCLFHISIGLIHESCNGGTVIVGNKAPYKVMRLTTTNGWRLTLTRMRHVPTLGKNLISLDTLNDFGYNGVFSN